MVCRSPLWHLRAAVSAVVRWCSTAVIERWHCGQLVQKENRSFGSPVWFSLFHKHLERNKLDEIMYYSLNLSTNYSFILHVRQTEFVVWGTLN